MNDRISVKSDQQIVSTEAGLAATIGFAFWRPVGGEMFFLTAPFIEHYGVLTLVTRYSIKSADGTFFCGRARIV
jgi:hypothetical protein